VEDGFFGLDGRGDASPASWRLTYPTLAAYLDRWQKQSIVIVGLKTRFVEAETRNEALEETIVNLTHENELLKRRIYGNKTERAATWKKRAARVPGSSAIDSSR
jgi:hypothetical protein